MLWGLVSFVGAVSNLFSSDDSVRSADDGTLFILNHLAVKQVKAVTNGYWFRASIDEKWYYGKFIPAVRKYLKAIAPTAKTAEFSINTKDLAYAEDGADGLNNELYHDDDRWAMRCDNDVFDPGRGRTRSGRDAEDERLCLVLIDEMRDHGNTAHGMRYFLNELEMQKFKNWVYQKVLPRNDSVNIEVAVSAEGRYVKSSTWNLRFDPFDMDYSCGVRYGSCLITPWYDCRNVTRCHFLGLKVSQSDEALSKDVSFKWSL